MAKKEKVGTVRGIGDNGEDVTIDPKKLESFVASLEKLDRKKDQVLQEMRETYANIKAIGYHPKSVRRIIKERKMEPDKLKEEQDLLALHKRALNMLDEE